MTKTPGISPLPKSVLPFRTSTLRASNGYAIFQAEPGNYVAYVKDIQDANFVVSACNNYHRLEAENKALREQQKPHLCPVCNGVKTLPANFYWPHVVTTSASPVQCQSCGGNGVIWLPPPPKEDGV